MRNGWDFGRRLVSVIPTERKTIPIVDACLWEINILLTSAICKPLKINHRMDGENSG